MTGSDLRHPRIRGSSELLFSEPITLRPATRGRIQLKRWTQEPEVDAKRRA